LPKPVQNLLTVARLKVYGAEYGITQVTTKGDDLILTMEEGQNERIDGKKLVALSQSFERKLKVMPGPQIVIHINRNGLSMEETLQMLEKFLQQYADVLIPEDADRTSTSAI
jgi:transcription-repair coupling factor (superfamily II helicase)